MFRRSKQQAISFLTVFITFVQEKHFFSIEKIELIDSNILQQNDLTKDLLFGSEKLKDDKNNALLTSKIQIPVISIINNRPIRLAFTL